MAWRDERVRAYIERLEREATRHPRRYLLRLVGLAFLGYAYPAMLVLLALSAIMFVLWMLPYLIEDQGTEGLVGWVVLLAVALAFAWWVVRGLLVERSAPSGRELTPGEAPALRALIADVSHGVNAPPIHGIFLTPEFNAGVIQHPRFLIFGPTCNYLIIGMALLTVSTADELRAVLAHEFGHLRREHGRLNAWLYHAHKTWESLGSEQMQHRLRFTMLRWFFNWYPTHLAIATLPLRRRHEYEADRAAAECEGTSSMTNLLIAHDWFTFRMEKEFWPMLRREAATAPIPPPNLLEILHTTLTAPPDLVTLRAWWRHDGLRRSVISEEHPCLLERVAALGCSERIACADPPCCLPPATLEESALTLLGTARERQVTIANATWKAQIIDGWRSAHQHAVDVKKQAEKLAESASINDAWTVALARIKYAGQAEAISLLHDFLNRYPDNPGAAYMLGYRILEQEDPAGVAYIETAMHGDSDYITPGLQLLLEYYRSNGQDAQADAIIARLEAHQRETASASKERASYSPRNELMPHGLKEEELEHIRRILRRYVRVTAAFLARKKVAHLSDKPAYVLAVTCDPYSELGDFGADTRMAAAIADDIPFACAVVICKAGHPLRARLAQFENACVYGNEGF